MNLGPVRLEHQGGDFYALAGGLLAEPVEMELRYGQRRLARIMHTLGQKESEKGRKAIRLHCLRAALMAGPVKQIASQRAATFCRSQGV